MNKRDSLFRAARAIQHTLSCSAATIDTQLRGEMRSLLEYQVSVQQCWRRCELASSRHWRLAAAAEQERLMQLLPQAQYYMNSVLQYRRNAPSFRPAIPTLRDLLAELKQLQEEFEDVRIDIKKGVIAVRTDRILLEDIDLGRFQIELHLERLKERIDSSVVEIAALDPNPPTSNDDVTHPHVSGQGLCAGDASVPIQAALREGRICDLFLLINAVLTTYNPGSAYVALSEWDGIACGECGYSCNRDDLFYCPGCEKDFCESCISMCDECDESYCGGCLERDCTGERRLCRGCREICPKCRCFGRSTDIAEHGMCEHCYQLTQQKEMNHENDERDNERAGREIQTGAA